MPYKKASDAPANIRKLDGVALTLGQLNEIAAAVDAISKTDAKDKAWPIAISQFKDGHVVNGGKWEPKAKKEADAKAATDAEKKAQEARAEKCGIAPKDGGNVTKPSKYKDVPDSKFLDETNYAYPVDAEHLVPALVYFNRAGQRGAGGYSAEEWAIMGKKLASLMGGKVYKDGNVVDKAEKEFTGFKAVGDKWWGLWTNAFQDRDKETFATDSIEEFTDWWWKERPDTPLWFWHVPFAMGTVELVGGVGRFAIAAGTLNETGQKTTGYYEAHPEQKLAMSHMYLWSTDRKSRDGVYSWFRTKEITFLPALKAANEYTLFGEVKAMELSDEKKAKLTEILGDKEAEMVITAALSATKELEEAGVAYKQVSGSDLETLQGLVDGLTDEKEKAKFQEVLDGMAEEEAPEEKKEETGVAARFQALVDEVSDPELKARLAAGVAQAMSPVAEVVAELVVEAPAEATVKAAEEPAVEERLVLDDEVISQLAVKITDLLGKPDVESIRAEVAQMRKELADSQAKLNEVAKSDEQKMKELLAKQPKVAVYRASRAQENVAAEAKEAATVVDPMGLSLKDSIAKINAARDARAIGR